MLNSGINLVVGLALLLVWRSDRAQQFPGWMGASFVVQAISPVAFLAWSVPALNALGFWALAVAGATSLALWLIGAAYLAGRSVTRAQGLIGWAALTTVAALALEVSPRFAQGISATLTTLAALLALAWVFKRGRYERAAAIAMLLLGLNQFIWVVHGNAGLPLQATIAAVLRVVLGFALLHAALQRRHGESGQMRDQFMHLIERSHQGIAVMQGEAMKDRKSVV